MNHEAEMRGHLVAVPTMRTVTPEPIGVYGRMGVYTVNVYGGAYGRENITGVTYNGVPITLAVKPWSARLWQWLTSRRSRSSSR